MKRIKITFGFILLIFFSCFIGYFYSEGNALIYSDTLYEIYIGYDCRDLVRVYFVPKNENICDVNIFDLKANAFRKFL
jgi:hypothetical protein